MALKLDEKTGVYHYTTDSGFHLALVAEGAMDYACKIKDEKIESQAKEIEGLREFKQMVKDYHTTFPAKEQFRAIELLKGTTQPDKGGG
jgi:hypothetical protein